MSQQLDRIEAKLDRLAAALDRAGPLLDELPGVLATVGNITDDLARVDGPARMDQRVRGGAAVLAKLTDPAVLGPLEQLLERGAELGKLVAFLDALPGYVALLGDSFDGLIEAGRARGIEPEALLRGVFESGVLEQRSVELLAATAAELPRAAAAPSEHHGLLGLLRVLREDEVQRTLSFLIHLSRRLGRVLDEHTQV
ncbi:DUF1641 domain-containing protein [Enhygromyxa salina]|nr:DUF1641 domain-containing protein [Enhygromyxa salina]